MSIVNNRPSAQAELQGKVTRRWFSEGYKAGLEDIACIVDNGDNAAARLDLIRIWIEDNSGVRFE